MLSSITHLLKPRPGLLPPPLRLKLKVRGKKKRTTRQHGDILEKRVVKILEREGRSAIQRNVFFKDKHGNRSEIDIVYGNFPWNKRYIECKHYSRPVPLSDVAKFKEVLRLNDIPLRQGIFVTTATFTPRSEHVGVALVNGEELKAWEKRALRIGLYRTVRKTVLGSILFVIVGASAFDQLVAAGVLEVPEEFQSVMPQLEEAKAAIAGWYKLAQDTIKSKLE